MPALLEREEVGTAKETVGETSTQPKVQSGGAASPPRRPPTTGLDDAPAKRPEKSSSPAGMVASSRWRLKNLACILLIVAAIAIIVIRFA